MKTWIVCSLCLLALLTACENTSTTGSGTIVSQERSVGSSTAIEYRGSADVIITYGATTAVRVEADDNFIDKISTTVVNGTLKINQSGSGYTKATVYLSTPVVSSIISHGSGKLEMGSGFDLSSLLIHAFGSGNIHLNSIQVEGFTTQLNGSGSIYASGNATAHNCQIRSSGSLYALDLSTVETAVAIFGSGNAEVNASSRLYADILGSGSVVYRGDPVLTSTVKGSGTITQLP